MEEEAAVSKGTTCLSFARLSKGLFIWRKVVPGRSKSLIGVATLMMNFFILVTSL